MPEVFVSSLVNASAEKVWATIRRFDAVADWLPFVKSSPIEDGGDPTRVGCVRILTQTDGAVFREALVALSDAERFYSYTVREFTDSSSQSSDNSSCIADNGW